MIEIKPLPGKYVPDILEQMYHTVNTTKNTEVYHVMVNGVRVIMFKETFNK